MFGGNICLYHILVVAFQLHMHAHFNTIIARVGKKEQRCIAIGQQGYLNRQHALLELHLELLAPCRRTLGGERHRYAFA